ncbi:ribonuclease hi [Plakobranchus ocellatus]|uniref:Ribonuclease hi n=1 Tax=Plakobranchus ocellatus TaxID=259542 RepID=A0AAV4A1L7_9GAST|nr:ribonuclease hi [Plakobranchus ocellatus]
MDTVVKWNIRGFRSNFEELKLLLNRSQSAVVALQECRLGRGSRHPGVTPYFFRGGLLIRNGIRFSEIDLKTGLHGAAATISLEKTLTVCSLYLPPNSPVSLAELFEQLPKPFLVLGDFNAHSPDDSLLALQAIQSKNFKVKDIRRLFNFRKFPPFVHITFVWIPAHVGIQGNENVDKLAKAALNKSLYSGKLICWFDLKAKVNAYIHTVWHENWDTEGANKLHDVLPNLGKDLHKRGQGAGRKRETVVCRLQVGHTWLT